MALALASLSFTMTVIWGSPVLRILRYYKIGEKIRIVSPRQHFTKLGTPTMGGVLFIAPVTLLTILLNAVTLLGLDVLGRSVLLPLGTMLSFAALGMVSDWRRVRGLHPSGLRPRYKLLIQTTFAVLIAFGLWRVLDVPEMYLPFYKGEFEMGIWFVPAAAFVIVAAANAATLTAGVNGLSGMIAATAFASYGAIAIFQSQIFIVRFCFTITGAVLGFLWFNIQPASLVMGYTGSFSLGATLAVVAFMTGQWPLLPFIFAIPVIEVASVILQIIHFRFTGGRRVFRMAPLHHHFKLGGWSETQIVQRFWLINFLFAMIGVALALV
ncbi:MAG: phospho-N-acetylmuramoyl-pentapeptide-transferase [Anaerolineales bacterium]